MTNGEYQTHLRFNIVEARREMKAYPRGTLGHAMAKTLLKDSCAALRQLEASRKCG